MLGQDDELEPIMKTLLARAERYQAELTELNSKANLVGARLAQIQAAVSALQGSPVAKSNASKARTTKRAVPTRAQIELILEQVTKEKGTVKRHALEELVKAKLLASGLSRAGVSKQLDDILKSQVNEA